MCKSIRSKFFLFLLLSVNLRDAFIIDNNDICLKSLVEDSKEIKCDGVHKYKCDSETCAFNKTQCRLFIQIKMVTRSNLMPFASARLKNNTAIIESFLGSIKKCSNFKDDSVKTQYCLRSPICYRVKDISDLTASALKKRMCSCEAFYPRKSLIQCPHNSKLCAQDLETCEKSRDGLLDQPKKCNKNTKIIFEINNL